MIDLSSEGGTACRLAVLALAQEGVAFEDALPGDAPLLVVTAALSRRGRPAHLFSATMLVSTAAP